MGQNRRFRRVRLNCNFPVACALTVIVSTAVAAAATSPVRVGTRSRVDHVELEVHETTGNLFAVVSFTVPATAREPLDTYGAAVNISTDGGGTWTESFSSSSANRTEHLSTTIAHDYLYMITERGGAESGLVDVRRFAISDGGADGSFGFHTVVDVGDGQLEDLVLFSNADGVDGALYLSLIERGGNLRFFHAWDYAFADGATAEDWHEIDTLVTDANWGIDGAYNHGDSPYAIFVCYYDSSLRLTVWRLSQTANDATVLTTDFATNDLIRIAADGDLVSVVYSRPNGLDRDIRTHYSTDAGATWDWEPLAEVPGDGTSYGAATAVNRWHRGVMVGYHAMGTGGDRLATTRRPVEAESWTTPSVTGGIGLRTGTRTDIQPLVAGGWGVLFVSDAGDPQAVYFMVDPLIFADGFETADHSMWSTSARTVR